MILSRVIPQPIRLAILGGRGQMRLSRRLAAVAAEAVDEVSMDDVPVLVFQMGGVGSSTTLNSLVDSGMETPVFHLHFLGNRGVRRAWQRTLDAGHFPPQYHLYTAREISRRMRSRSFPRCRIVSLVRDPVAREISGMFQVQTRIIPPIVDHNDRLSKTKALEHVQTRLRREHPCSWALNWFDRQFQPAIGVDVYANSFDSEQGWGRFECEMGDVLVLQCEKLDQLIPTVLSDFVGLSRPAEVRSRNVRRTSKDAEEYEFVRRTLRIDEAAADRIYKSRFVTHFYSAEQIDGFVEYWTRPA